MKHKVILDRLISEDAVIFPSSFSGAYAAYPNGDRRRRPVCWLNTKQFTSIRADGVLQADGKGFRVNRSAVRRLQKKPQGGNPHAAQHRVMEEREQFVFQDSLRTVQVNTRLTPLRSFSRASPGAPGQVLSSHEIEAGERFAKDYEFGGMNTVATQNFQSVSGVSVGAGASDLPANRLDARNRVMNALSALGPSLDKVVTSVCVYELSLERFERAEVWMKGSGFTVLKLGLQRLVIFYGTQVGQKRYS